MHAKGTGMVQLVSSSNCSYDSSGWTPDKVMGKIMVCLDWQDDTAGILLQKAGGAGIVTVDLTAWSRDGGARSYPFTLPGLTLGVDALEKLKAYLASTANPVASFSFGCETVTDENRAPVVAGFSSRGPNHLALELLKRDVVAPGTNILAA